MKPVNAHPLWSITEQLSPRFFRLADEIFDTPETCYMEHRSFQAQIREIEEHGFRVRKSVAGIETALVAETGEGGPVIAFLGEYDALPGLSQAAGVAEHQPVVSGAPGHGCGHNMLGAGAMLAAVSVAEWLRKMQLPGRVRYYGCPAEEGGAAKSFMVKAGLFDDVDIAFCWHPNQFAEVIPPDTLAATTIDFVFRGISAHASGAPQIGRSALDAVELMSVGVNYLREHMPNDARIHYAILDGGGIAPNVVQAYTKVRYSVRGRTSAEMHALLARVRKVAAGAALMTETSVSDQVISAMSELIPCHPLNALLRRHLDNLGPPSFSAEEEKYARAIRATVSDEDIAGVYLRYDFDPDPDAPLGDFLMPADAFHRTGMGAGSTDVGDVSWVVPTAQLHGANYAIGTPFHSWQMTAQSKSSAAYKGMLHASQVLAATAAELFADPELISECKRDHERRAGKARYISPMPLETVPPIVEMQAMQPGK